MKKLIFGILLSVACVSLSAQGETDKRWNHSYKPHRIGNKCDAAKLNTSDYPCAEKPKTPRKQSTRVPRSTGDNKKPEGTIPNLQPR